MRLRRCVQEPQRVRELIHGRSQTGLNSADVMVDWCSVGPDEGGCSPGSIRSTKGGAVGVLLSPEVCNVISVETRIRPFALNTNIKNNLNYKPFKKETYESI